MKEKTRTVTNIGLGWIIPAIIVTAGCGPSLQETRARDHLANAKAMHAAAKANPNVEINARIPMMEADKALTAASQAREFDEMEHLAYLSVKKTRIAVAASDEQMAEDTKKGLAAQTELLMAQGLEREQKANMAASASRDEARTQAYKAEMARDEVVKLQQEIEEMKGRITDRGIVLTLGDMLFNTGSATLSSNADHQIGKLSAFLMKYPDRKLSIEGHTDSIGSAENNRNLSFRRATAVSDQLISREIGSNRITIKGFGEESPIAGNDNAFGQQQNRRVEVIILNERLQLHTRVR